MCGEAALKAGAEGGELGREEGPPAAQLHRPAEAFAVPVLREWPRVWKYSPARVARFLE